jgi:PBSX family phage terminase large subunit
MIMSSPINEAEPILMRGAAAKLMQSVAPAIVIEGPAGTGKTMAVLTKVVERAERFPDSRHLLLRKTRESMTESVLVELESTVIAPWPELFSNATRRVRQSYTFPNDSTIVCGGLDKWSKVMSTQYDTIAVFEATEIDEEAWEILTATRLRNGKCDYHQAIADCNPDKPSHWLNRRAQEGKMQRLISRHTDNPRWYDSFGRTTREGEEYIERLNQLTGHRRRRLFEGIWSAPEGMVYEDWDPLVHVVGVLPFEPRWHVASVDWGFRDPGVFQMWAVGNDKVMGRVAEIYLTETNIEDWCKYAVRIEQEFRPRAWVCDPSEPGYIDMLRKTLSPIGGRVITNKQKPTNDLQQRDTSYKPRDIRYGIDLVAARLREQPDGRRRLYMKANSNKYVIDKKLREDRMPWCTEQEIESYVYEEPQEGKAQKDVPMDLFNHGMDAMRYAVVYVETMSTGQVYEVGHVAD